MGRLDGGYQYQTMGAGECADRQDRRMARYSGDVQEAERSEDLWSVDT